MRLRPLAGSGLNGYTRSMPLPTFRPLSFSQSKPPAPGVRIAERRRASAAMFTAALLFALMGVSAKWASEHAPAGTSPLPAGEIACIRYLFGLVFLTIYARIAGMDLWGNDRPGLLYRGVAGGVAATLYFMGIQKTLLTNAVLLNNTSVVWAPIVAAFSLKERLRAPGAAAVALALVGVMLVTQPRVGTVHFGDVIALASGIVSGFAVVQIRRLRQGETPFAIFFYFNLLGLPVALATLWLTHTPLVLPTVAQTPVLLAVGATSVSAQLLMTYGYKEMTAAQGSLISLTAILYAALLATALFLDPLTPPKLVGGALILLASILSVARPNSRR